MNVSSTSGVLTTTPGPLRSFLVKLIAADALLRLEDTELDHEKIGRFKPRSLPSPGSGFMAFLRKRYAMPGPVASDIDF